MPVNSDVARSNLVMLVCEDSEDDFHFIEIALNRSGINASINWVRDGVEATHYLEGKGVYADRAAYPRPSVLFVDLKMPRMGGLDLLLWLNEHPQHQVVPTVVLSSSMLPSDVARAYRLGANTYFVKPIQIDVFVSLFKLMGQYWDAAIKPSQVTD